MTTILVTGSRYYNGDLSSCCCALAQLSANMFPNQTITLIHGGAKGADSLAAQQAHKLGWETISYLPEWETYGKKGGPIRNTMMVDQHPHFALAVLAAQSVGTRDCLKKLATSTKLSSSRLHFLLLVDAETGQARWLNPSELLEEFG